MDFLKNENLKNDDSKPYDIMEQIDLGVNKTSYIKTRLL